MIGGDAAPAFDPARLFEPDTLAGAKGNGARPTSGELALLWALLADGVRAYLSTTSDRWLRRESDAWVRSDRRGFLSFVFLCEVFDIDPQALRQELVEMRRAGRAFTAKRAYVRVFPLHKPRSRAAR